MDTLSCLIVDDEPNALKLLEDHIQKVPFLELKQKCYDAFEALNFLKKESVDLLFLDIQMPEMTGMELAAVVHPNQLIIFTTAYSSYALDGYEFNAIDYLLKPITFKRFMQAVNKVSRFLNPAREATLGEADAASDYIFIKSGKEFLKIEYKAILYIEAMKEYVNIVSINGKALFYKRMKQLEEQLPPFFLRIHNSYIINLNHFEKLVDNHVIIRKARLPVSAGYRDQITKFIEKKML